MFFDEFGEAQQDALFLGGGLVAPAAILKGGARSRDGCIDVGGVAIGYFASNGTIHRRNFVEGFTGFGWNILAIDKGAAFGDSCSRTGNPGFFRRWAVQHDRVSRD